MSKIFIGSIINGFKILKKIFNSFIPDRSIYKVKCIACGAIYKLRLIDIKNEICMCKTSPIDEEEKVLDEKRRFSRNIEENVGIHRGKYVVVGYLKKPFEQIAPSMKTKPRMYIVKCKLCGELVIMSNNNLNAFREKRDKGVTCNHKIFFDPSMYEVDEYFINWKLVNEF